MTFKLLVVCQINSCYIITP